MEISGALNIKVPNTGDTGRFVLATERICFGSIAQQHRPFRNKLVAKARRDARRRSYHVCSQRVDGQRDYNRLASRHLWRDPGWRGRLGGTVITYSIGGLNTNTEFAGTITSENVTSFGSTTGGTNITKVGTGTLTLSGVLSYSPNTLAAKNANLRGGVTTITAGTLARATAERFLVRADQTTNPSTIDIRSGRSRRRNVSNLSSASQSADDWRRSHCGQLQSRCRIAGYRKYDQQFRRHNGGG